MFMGTNVTFNFGVIFVIFGSFQVFISFIFIHLKAKIILTRNPSTMSDVTAKFVGIDWHSLISVGLQPVNRCCPNFSSERQL